MLVQRVASAAVGIPVIFLLVLVGGWPFAVAVAAALAVAALEFAHLRFPWRSQVSFLSAAVVFLLALGVQAVGFVLVPAVAFAALVRGGLWWARTRSVPTPPVWTSLGVLYVGVLGATFVLLRDLPNGRDWVYLVLFSTFAVDTAAYFTGRAIGRHRLAPRISPKKTWEGFAGGWIGGASAAIVLNYALGLRIDAADIALIAVLLPLAATAGDLIESATKRWTDVKDASELIPGHGGVLDRIDSLLLTFPLVYLIARFIVL